MSGPAKEEPSVLKRALLAIDRLQAKLDAVERAKHEPIAVIGMGCRFPGARNPQEFWQLLRDGVDAVGEVPSSRWDIDSYYDPDPGAPGKMSTRWGAFLSDIDQFDAQFFGITPREAVSLDPQQRLLLEVAWEALEDAAQSPDRLKGTRTGVFVGILSSDYADLQLAGDGVDRIDAYFGSGTARSVASGRLSYVFGLQGPSVSIDTACSSSLVATHLACQSLRTGETRMALAAGVNLILTPESTIALSRYRMMAADGRCKAFDKRADGYVRGEGCGVLVLKRLSDAIADGDRVLAVIRGSAVNQDGASSGLTAPNGPSQEAVIRDALTDAGLAPEQVSYVEAHGTGTSLGDPIEMQAVARVLGQNRPADRPIAVGTVKANVGHTEAAAGIAGVIKAVLCLQHRAIPPHLHFEEPNPFIPWKEIPVQVPRALTAWPQNAPLVAGVSSFGFSGTNAHLVLEASPDPVRRDAGVERSAHLLTVSGATDTARQKAAAQLLEYFDRPDAAAWSDVCFTANVGRAHLPYRATIVAADAKAARAALADLAAGRDSQAVMRSHVRTAEQPPVAFLFTGQGAQYAGMGRQLFDTQPAFRRTFAACDALMKAETGSSLLEVISGAAGAGLLNQTGYAQPALFAIEAALADMWRSWGIEPSAVLGHSVGEFVAAYVAGVFGLEDGMRLVIARARLMQSLPAGGRMAAVLADAERVARVVSAHADKVSIAAINAPDSTVISGEADAVQSVIAALEAEGVPARPLVVSHAFHSPLMEPILDEFERVASGVTYKAPQIRLVSNVTGKVAPRDAAADGNYWRRHVRGTVLFAAGLQELHRQGISLFLELGPGGVLSGLGARTVKDATFVSTVRDGRDEWQATLQALARVYGQGVRVDWAGFDREYFRRPVALPTTPFERSRHWVQVSEAGRAIREVRASRTEDHPLLHRSVPSPEQDLFEAQLDTDTMPVIRDHRVHGVSILPATAFVELALAAGARVAGRVPALETFEIREPLPFRDGERTIQVVLSATGAPGSQVRIYSMDEPRDERASWTLHAEGRLTAAEATPVASMAVADLKARCPEQIDGAAHYGELARRGYDFGPALQGVRRIWRRDGEAIAEVELPAAARLASGAYHVPPALLDCCLQFCWALLPDRTRDDSYLPMSIGALRVHATPPDRVWSHITMRQGASGDGQTFVADVQIADESGRVVAEIGNMLFRRAGREVLERALEPKFTDALYDVKWVEKPLAASAAPTAANAPAVALPDLRAAVDRAFPALAGQHGLESHRQLVHTLERVSLGYVTRAFGQLGYEFVPGTEFGLAEIMGRLGVLPKYERLMFRLLQMYEEDGVLARSGARYIVQRRAEVFDPQSEMDRLAATATRSGAQLELTSRCGRDFAGAITGKVDPLSLLFPGGSLDLAERLYRELPEGQVFNSLAGAAVADAVRQFPAGRPLRVIEAGAGTGGVTTFVLPQLPADRTDYYFTDVSSVFLGRAKRKLKDFPFVRYQLFNAERPGPEQGFEAHSFDIAIAANSLHATSDMHTTMSNIRQLLRPDGVLVLLEGTGPERWIDLTFGLTDGWWAFTDTTRRPSYPLLSRASWRTLLADVGFASTDVAPTVADASNQAIVLASAGTAAPAADASRWLICADEGNLADALAERLGAQGMRADVIGLSDLASGERLEAVLKAADGVRDVVYLSMLDAREPDLVPPSSLEPTERSVLGGLLTLVQSIGSARLGTAPRLHVVTRGAQATGDEAPVAVAQAPVLGFCKVVDLEHPELACRRLDLDPSRSAESQMDALVAELLTHDEENQIALRRGSRRLPRLSRISLERNPAPPRASSDPIALRAGSTGVLDDLAWHPLTRRTPGPGEVEILVHASGLGFRDVMNALAMRSDADPLGSECAGVIAAVGEGVTGLAVGDEVVALAPGSLASHAIARADLVVRKPARLSFEEAVSFPTAAVTAYYALHEAGKLRAGERVLIHAGTGGVGLAAVQIARSIGAEVFATAGTDAKRAFLRSIGVTHVFSSRTTDFADGIARATGGRGVDVVLNSLAGEFIAASVSALAPEGRFLEIGKRDIWSAERFRAERPRGAYHVIDLASGTPATHAALTVAFRTVIDRASRGEITPLPLQLYPWHKAAAAFRQMAQAGHIGKIVVTPPTGTRDDAMVRPDATYLITGGLAGLGLLTAEWLAAQGARNLVLLGRRAPGDAARETLDRIGALGVRVEVHQVDVADRAALAKVLASIAETMPPLRGVVHSAGVLRDGVLLGQEWSRFAEVMAPKVDGTWNLHALTLGKPLDFFVLFSSVAGLIGSSAQANHASANAFMDALAHERQARGWPALSINWGVWSEIGSAAERQAGDRVKLQGVGTIDPAQGLRVLGALMSSTRTQAAVLPVDWAQYLRQFSGGAPAWLREVGAGARTKAAPASRAGEAVAVAGPAFREALADVPASRQLEAVERHVVEQVAAVIGLDPARPLDPEQPLNEIGLDSLMAVELRNRLSSTLALERGLPATLVFDYPTVTAIATYLLTDVLRIAQPAEPAAAGGRGNEDVLSAIEGLSDEAVERMLSREV